MAHIVVGDTDTPARSDPRPLSRARSVWVTSDRSIPQHWQLNELRFARTHIVDLGVLFAGVAAVLVGWLQPWRNSLRVPLGYVNDSLPVNMQIQSIIETGWFQRNDRLGAPFGQELYDYPFGADNGNFLIIKAMTLVSQDSHLLFNAFYLLGFFTAAAAAYVVSLRLGTGRIMAVTIGFVYAIAPYHFLRIGHTLLAHYAVVPVSVLLAARVASGRSLPWAQRRWPALAGWFIACVAVGSFGAYYAIFGLLTIAMFAVFSAAANRSRRPLVAGVVIGGIVSVSLVTNLVGSLLYRIRNGVNDEAVLRIPLELDLYSFRIVQALTPPPGTRLPGLDSSTSVLDEGSPSEPSMYFGLIGAVALIAMLVVAVARIVARRPDDSSTPWSGVLLGTTMVWILLASAGGLNWLLLLVGLNELRAWGRVSILLLFLVLVWGARASGDALQRRRVPGPAQVAVALALAAVAVLDQVGVAPPPAESEAAFDVDRNFFTAVDARLDADDMVGQLPPIRFPEGGFTNGAGPYDQLRPFLHVEDSSFGFGGMRGREAEWQQQLADLDVQQQIDALIATGHDAAIYLLPAYPDAGAGVFAGLEAVGVENSIVSSDGTWLFFELDPSYSELDAQQSAALRDSLFTDVTDD